MQELTALLAKYAAVPAQEMGQTVMETLSQSQVYIPAAADKNVVPMQGNLMGLKPDSIPAGEGEVLFPVFSDTDQIPDGYGARFTFLHLPFPQFYDAAKQDPRFAGIVIDPFTSKFVLSGK